MDILMKTTRYDTSPRSPLLRRRGLENIILYISVVTTSKLLQMEACERSAVQHIVSFVMNPYNTFCDYLSDRSELNAT